MASPEVLASITTVYAEKIATGSPKNVQQLELSQYLEKKLWPAYNSDDNSVLTHPPLILSIIAMVNEKFRERATVWETFEAAPGLFPRFFTEVTRLALSDTLSIKEKTSVLIFLIHCFNSVEIELVRTQIQKYISMPIWHCLSPRRLQAEFNKAPKLKKFWKKLQKADEKQPADHLAVLNYERTFLSQLIFKYFTILSSISVPCTEPAAKKTNWESIRYCERFIEFLIDLEALLPTRRFFNALLDDLHVLTVSRLSPLYAPTTKEGKLFSQLLENLRFYVKFEIDDVTGEALTDSQIAKRHFDKMTSLQKTAYKFFADDGEFRDLYLASVSAIDSRESLLKYLGKISEEKLTILCSHLGVGLDNETMVQQIAGYFPKITKKELLLEILVDFYGRKESQLKELNSLPLYPSEQIIWDENLVPSEYYNGDGVLALPKLNIQFLTLHDYLLRNFHLFRLESTYEIRQDIEAAVAHLKPWQTEDGGTMFGGWARMALPIDSFAITEIGRPKIGEHRPAKVKAEVVVNLNVKRNIKAEWEALRKHDVCFLVTVRPDVKVGTAYNYKEPFVPQVGLTYVRGCEVEGLLDPTGRLIDENPYAEGGRPHFETDFRTYRVLLDTNQYKYDMETNSLKKLEETEAPEEIYDSFNILVRRKSKANNFKAVLETIRDLMNTKCVVPEWLHDVILGYGDPSAAHYSNLTINRELFPVLDFFDTFLDIEHVQQAFPGFKVKCNEGCGQPEPPFKLEISEEEKMVSVMPYKVPSRGPYVTDLPKRNAIRFTPMQVEAIRSGIQHGLTMVVGPPGTGKTDLAVQIISTLYHNHPNQRTLIVTHSNTALNQMFEKIMKLDIDERHLLRLGHGEEELETEKDFSRYGRVNWVLRQRLELLEQVGRLATSLGLTTDVAYTCETAGYFYLYYVLSKWEAFQAELDKVEVKTAEVVAEKFPFSSFFADVEQLWTGSTFEANFDIARGCFRYIKKIFTQLEEFRAFEMLRPGPDRANYLLVREAKIIAMTCTHAALKRAELVQLAFQYDNILMEESAQILEIETFIPLLLQNPEFGHNRLKRWIMIGDHLQLPPVIKNMSFQKFSNMEQSLFGRFVRLGVPTIYLDAQGRSRGSICSLWSWRYKNLGNLEHVEQMAEFERPNAGFVYDYQLINVEDFNGVGESEPIPYFYQNLAEAEFIVATFMYMRLLGYPASKITILTTYNGQKHLLRDVIQQRCATNPFIGRPAKVTTVDKFQGQQNDYILLSLVRTKTVGHLRDIRRLTVAMSRARLGLYIFARGSLFGGCYELQKTFNMLAKRPAELALLPTERFGDDRGSEVQKTAIRKIATMPEMVQFVFEFYQQVVTQMQAERPEEFRRIMAGETAEAVQEEEEMEPAMTQEDEVPFEPLGEDDQALDDDIEMEEEVEEVPVVKKVKVVEEVHAAAADAKDNVQETDEAAPEDEETSVEATAEEADTSTSEQEEQAKVE